MVQTAANLVEHVHDVADLLQIVQARILRLLRRRGVLAGDTVNVDEAFAEDRQRYAPARDLQADHLQDQVTSLECRWPVCGEPSPPQRMASGSPLQDPSLSRNAPRPRSSPSTWSRTGR